VLLTSLAYILDRTAVQTEAARTLSQAKLARVLDYIHQHLDRNITLAELAALVELTPRYFCEVFRRTTGRPPHQFQIEQRIERAKSLLERPSVPLREVALMAGFSSQSHLNVYFRRIAGMTPARYRAQCSSLGTTLAGSLRVKGARRSLA
jgi:AraC family transcriptional regulator